MKARSARMREKWRDPRYREDVSRHMKALWATPEHREKMSRAMAERDARPDRKITGRPPSDQAYIRGTKAIVTVGFDEDQRERLVRLAKLKRRTMADLIRTYVEWGLEAEGAE